MKGVIYMGWGFFILLVLLQYFCSRAGHGIWIPIGILACSLVTEFFLLVNDTWLMASLINLAYWAFWSGLFYLLHRIFCTLNHHQA